jgi:serralysin
VWNTDGNGNYVSDTIGAVAGSDLTLENLELSFQQDLNGDGRTGPQQITIEAQGVTRLVEVGNQFQMLDASNSGPTLKLQGAPALDGQFAPWKPIGAEKTTTGYEVAWRAGTADQYTVWNTDNNGNYVSDTIGIVAGSNLTLENLEFSFQQDLNGDGHVGPPSVAASGDLMSDTSAASIASLGNYAASAFVQSTVGPGQIVWSNALDQQLPSTATLVLHQ